jgi:polysaccharide export outer membrane protein
MSRSAHVGHTIACRASTALFLLSLFLLTGCAQNRATPNDKINLWLARQEIELPPAQYIVEAPDVLTISAPRIRELDQQSFNVRPDGKIFLNLLGELPVSGKTPDQIGRDIRQLASKFYSPEALDITVSVTEFNSKFVHVFGFVNAPGTRPFTGRETILAILAEVQLNDDAWPQKIVIVRPHDDVTVKQKVTIDIKSMYETGQVTENFLLENGDIVYIPPSPLAKTNITMERLLAPLRGTVSLASFAITGGGAP